MGNYYQRDTTEKPVKVLVIQYGDKGKRVEIIRQDRVRGRKTFAGFWIDTTELIEK